MQIIAGIGSIVPASLRPGELCRGRLLLHRAAIGGEPAACLPFAGRRFELDLAILLSTARERFCE